MRWMSGIVFALGLLGTQAAAKCEFRVGDERGREASFLHSMSIDAEQTGGLWQPIQSATREIREAGRFVGRMVICLETKDGRSVTIERGALKQTISSPHETFCTATLLSDNRIITSRHCLHSQDWADLGFHATGDVAVQFGYVEKDFIANVQTFIVDAQPLAVNRDLDTMVLQVQGDANAAMGGHFPMVVDSDVAPFDDLVMIHHPRGLPQQYSSGTCKIDASQASLPQEAPNLRHRCESFGGSSGALILNYADLSVVGQHQGADVTRDSLGRIVAGYNKGLKFAAIDAALDLGFTSKRQIDRENAAAVALAKAFRIADTEDRRLALLDVANTFSGTPDADVAKREADKLAPDPQISALEAEVLRLRQERQNAEARDKAERDANAALQSALAVADPATRVDLLAQVQQSFPNTNAATLAAQARNVAQTSLNNSADKQTKAASVPFAVQMVDDPDVLRCDTLAGHPDHPDKANGLMRAPGIRVDDIAPGPAIAACEAALDKFLAQSRLMTNYGRALLSDGNNEDAFKVFRSAAKDGDPIAQLILGEMFDQGLGVPQSDKDAVEWYRKSATQGYAKAQVILGWMYANGLGVARSHEEAAKWYEKAALQGDVHAQFNLGIVYKNGSGVPLSYENALFWYRKAAEQNYASAQNSLGWMYENGLGVAQSDKDAIEWYLKAADQGNAKAQVSLGWMYEHGRGFTKSYSNAATWYEKAARQGDSNGQVMLGILYEFGRGVPKSESEAIALYRKAAEQGNGPGQENLDRLLKN